MEPKSPVEIRVLKDSEHTNVIITVDTKHVGMLDSHMLNAQQQITESTANFYTHTAEGREALAQKLRLAADLLKP